MTVTDEAVEAARQALHRVRWERMKRMIEGDRRALGEREPGDPPDMQEDARAALEAAAPHMLFAPEGVSEAKRDVADLIGRIIAARDDFKNRDMFGARYLADILAEAADALSSERERAERAERVRGEPCKPNRDAMLDRSEEGWDALFDAISTVNGFKVGQVLTEADVAALHLVQKCESDDEEAATDAYHRGHEEGLRKRGGDELVALTKRADEAMVEKATERAMRRFAEVRADRAELLLALALECARTNKEHAPMFGVAEGVYAVAVRRGDQQEARAKAAEAKVKEAGELLDAFGRMLNEDHDNLPDELVVSLTYDDTAYDGDLGGPNTLLGELFLRVFRNARSAALRWTQGEGE